jgi:hypothetical protein
MTTKPLKLLSAALIFLAQTAISQNVKLANVSLGMSEDEVKAALVSSAPSYHPQASGFAELSYLVVETSGELYAFTFIEGHVAAFSLMHILPPGQQTFLPPGQEPTVSTLRNLVIKRTWAPAAIRKGDTLWLSDATGTPISDASQCNPKSGEEWLPFGPVQSSKPGQSAPKSTEGLMKPSLASYPSSCGVSIHLKLTPSENENDRVSTVRIQVLDMKAMNAFLAKHPQR